MGPHIRLTWVVEICFTFIHAVLQPRVICKGENSEQTCRSLDYKEEGEKGKEIFPSIINCPTHQIISLHTHLSMQTHAPNRTSLPSTAPRWVWSRSGSPTSYMRPAALPLPSNLTSVRSVFDLTIAKGAAPAALLHPNAALLVLNTVNIIGPCQISHDATVNYLSKEWNGEWHLTYTKVCRTRPGWFLHL